MVIVHTMPEQFGHELGSFHVVANFCQNYWHIMCALRLITGTVAGKRF